MRFIMRSIDECKSFQFFEIQFSKFSFRNSVFEIQFSKFSFRNSKMWRLASPLSYLITDICRISIQEPLNWIFSILNFEVFFILQSIYKGTIRKIHSETLPRWDFFSGLLDYFKFKQRNMSMLLTTVTLSTRSVLKF